MKNLITVCFAAATLFSLSSCGFKSVDEGYRGIETRFGKVEGDPLEPGLHFYNPFTSSIFEMSVQERKIEGKTEVFTSDTQSTTITYAVTYSPKAEQVGHLYSIAGTQWDDRLIPQVVLGAMKDAVGQYKADDLISKRAQAAKAAEHDIQVALEKRGVVVSRLDFTNLDFSTEYEKAVEAKVTAVQHAVAEKNKTEQVREQANQQILTAKATAESMKIQTEALRQSQSLVQYEAVKKWDGHLPTIQGGTNANIIDVAKIMAGKQE